MKKNIIALSILLLLNSNSFAETIELDGIKIGDSREKVLLLLKNEHISFENVMNNPYSSKVVKDVFLKMENKNNTKGQTQYTIYYNALDGEVAGIFKIEKGYINTQNSNGFYYKNENINKYFEEVNKKYFKNYSYNINFNFSPSRGGLAHYQTIKYKNEDLFFKNTCFKNISNKYNLNHKQFELEGYNNTNTNINYYFMNAKQSKYSISEDFNDKSREIEFNRNNIFNEINNLAFNEEDLNKKVSIYNEYKKEEFNNLLLSEDENCGETFSYSFSLKHGLNNINTFLFDFQKYGKGIKESEEKLQKNKKDNTINLLNNENKKIKLINEKGVLIDNTENNVKKENRIKLD